MNLEIEKQVLFLLSCLWGIQYALLNGWTFTEIKFRLFDGIYLLRRVEQRLGKSFHFVVCRRKTKPYLYKRRAWDWTKSSLILEYVTSAFISIKFRISHYHANHQWLRESLLLHGLWILSDIALWCEIIGVDMRFMMICSRPRCLLVKEYLLGNTQQHKLNFLYITTM